MQDFRKLLVWPKAQQLNHRLYGTTNAFPRLEWFSRTGQIRRAATSITANLAAGCGRGSDADFSRFVQMAMGSACELESHLELAKDLKRISFIEPHTILGHLIEVKRMLSDMLTRLATRHPSAKLKTDR